VRTLLNWDEPAGLHLPLDHDNLPAARGRHEILIKEKNMAVAPQISLILQIGYGVFWTLVYILIIRLGFREKTFGMPVIALCTNISWEFVFSFVRPHNIPQRYIDVTWFVLDSVILYQVVVFGKSDFINKPARLFYPGFALSLILSLWAILSVTYEFRDWNGVYSAFGGNLLMSVLFVTMLLRRNNVCGQSMYIALFKMVGTVSASILSFTFYPSSLLLGFLYITIFLFDAIYLVLLYEQHTELAIDPWKRF
jgi:hypothetical protein